MPRNLPLAVALLAGVFVGSFLMSLGLRLAAIYFGVALQ